MGVGQIWELAARWSIAISKGMCCSAQSSWNTCGDPSHSDLDPLAPTGVGYGGSWSVLTGSGNGTHLNALMFTGSSGSHLSGRAEP
jgi:hypothetical protein